MGEGFNLVSVDRSPACFVVGDGRVVAADAFREAFEGESPEFAFAFDDVPDADVCDC